MTSSPTDKIKTFKEVGFQAIGRLDLSPVQLGFPIVWDEDPFSDRNWMFQLHGWRMLDVFFNRMLPQDVDFIAQVMTDWQQFQSNSPDATPWFWYDMSTGLRASKIAALLMWSYEQTKPIPLVSEVLQCLISEHVAHLSNPKELNHGNHGLFQLNGLMALLHALNLTGRSLPQQSAATEFTVMHMKEILQSQLGNYGVHTEDSPDYHFFALAKIRQILDAPWWQRSDMDIIQATLHKAEVAKEWLVTPELRCPPVGDSTESIKLKCYDRLTEWPHEKLDDSLGAQLDGYGVVRSSPEVPVEQSHYLFFQGSFHTSGHKHADCLSFVWQERGRYRLWDSGKYGYQKGEWRDYFLSTRAHNTVEVDEKNFSRQKVDSYGSAVQRVSVCDGAWLLAGKVVHFRLLVTHQRFLYYRPGIGVEVLDVIFNNQCEQTRNFTWWWHLGPDSTCENLSLAGGRFVDSQGEKLELHVASTLGSPQEVNSCFGQEEPRLVGWFSPSYLKTQCSRTAYFKYNTQQPKFAVVSRWQLTESAEMLPALHVEHGEVTVRGRALYEALLSLSEPGMELREL